ncbi:MAG: hypothetical protein KAX80_09515, partial [Planctomycetes bacterium]|nr:hypothetical protein [Planctomycetota bacterium]
VLFAPRQVVAGDASTLPEPSLAQTDDAVSATIQWGGKTVAVRFNKTGKLEGHLTITDTRGRTLVDAHLEQRVQSNEELIKAAQAK